MIKMRKCKFGVTRFGQVVYCLSYKIGSGKWDIQTDCQTCPFAKGQRTLNGGGLRKMVKIKDVPSEGDRLSLDDLPHEIVMIAKSEELREPREVVVDGVKKPKAGGLVVKFTTKDNKEVSQKYGKVSGAKLIEAMEKLGLKDTEELQKSFYKYKLTSMRSGFPRYIPFEKVEA